LSVLAAAIRADLIVTYSTISMPVLFVGKLHERAGAIGVSLRSIFPANSKGRLHDREEIEGSSNTR
jgi:hypothetical protein